LRVLKNKPPGQIQKRLWIILAFIGLFLVTPDLVFSQVSQEKDEFSYGERLFNEGFFDLAAIQFESYLENYPTSPKAVDAQYYIGECGFSSDRYEEAQRAYLKLIINYPASPLTVRAHFRIAELYEKMGMDEEAMESYSGLFEYDPESEKALESLYRSAGISMKLGHYRQCEDILHHLLEKAQSGEYRSKASLLLSELYYQKEEYEKAIVVLRSILAYPILENDEAEVNFHLGKIHEALGLWKECKVFYEDALKLPANHSLKQKALFRLGHLLKMFNEETNAIESFNQVILLEGQRSIQSEAFFQMGMLKKQMKDLPGALDAFERAENLIPLDFRIRYRKARCLESMGKSSEALTHYESLSLNTTCVDHIRKQSMLSSGYIYRKERNYQQALKSYDRYLRTFPEDQMVCRVLLMKAKICLQRLGYSEEGFSALREIWVQYPTSPVVPEARTLFARGLEKTGGVEEALKVFRIVRERYPMTPSAEFAETKIEQIELFHPLNYEKGISRFISLAQKFLLDPDDSSILLDMGIVCFNELHQYEEAVVFFSRYLEGDANSERRDEAGFYLARSEELQASERSDLDMLNRAISKYQTLLYAYPESVWADDSKLRLIINMDASGIMDEYETHLDFLNRYPESDTGAEIHYRLGMAHIESDSLGLAMQLMDDHMGRFPESPYREQVLFYGGRLRFRLGDYARADSVFQTYINVYPDGHYLPVIYYNLAKISSHHGDDSTAVLHLERLTNQYPSSSWADSARFQLGERYIQNKAYTKCLPLYREALVDDSLRQWSASMGLQDSTDSQRNIYLLGLARTYQGMGEYRNAKYYYLKYYRENQGPENLVLVYTALSRIAEQEGRIYHAEEYLNRILEEVNSADIIGSVGQLRFRLARYEEAIEAFDRALSMTESDEEKASISAKIIISLMRLGRVPQAEVRMNMFNQSFRTTLSYREYMSEFYLEKGFAHIQAKSFVSAREALQEVIQEYQNTTNRPRAEFEMARVNLITNKIEDALQMLTSMVDRYPNHPILARVYLNLGVHYFQSRQFENALRAFRLAMENEEAPEIMPVATRELIRVYDSLGMWDAALHRTREYIRRFPGADDILQKRVQIGNFYMDLNEFQRAVEIFREVKKDADYETQAEIQYWIGQCYNRMGQFERAIFELMKVGTLTRPTKLPWGTTALYDAGQAYIKLENPEQARKLFEKVIQKDGISGDMGRIARQRIQEIDEILKNRE